MHIQIVGLELLKEKYILKTNQSNLLRHYHKPLNWLSFKRLLTLCISLNACQMPNFCAQQYIDGGVWLCTYKLKLSKEGK